MKLIYCICSIYNPGGMERVLLNKVTYWVKKMHWDVTIVTTDQQNRVPFYPFPDRVRIIDLGINYVNDKNKNVWSKIGSYIRKRYKHKKALAALLWQEKADIVVSLYPSESSFIPFIKDGSKKVLELHYCKFFRLQYGRKGLQGFIDKLRTKLDEHIVSRFDKFVILTHEDRKYWGNLHNIEVIPNAALFVAKQHSDISTKRIIAIGRLDYQKGFDRLILAWDIVQQQGRYTDWTLDIFGQGEWYDLLQQMIDERGLGIHTHIYPPTQNIGEEYAKSSLLVMSSNYEGFPMVMIEAMACGLPVISFDYKCGPKEIIQHGKNGLLVPNGNIAGLADAMMEVMDDETYRRFLSENAKKIMATYSEETVMNQWLTLFSSLANR